jgi:cytochrome c556
MRKTVSLGVAIVLLGGSGLALAQSGGVTLKPDDIIAARQAAYDLQAGVASAMKAGVDGGQDVKPFTQGAKGMVAWGRSIPSMFPAGTEQGHNTKAKAEVWSDRAGFEKAAANFVAQAEKLVQLADANDKAGFATQFKATGEACGACHRPYRAQ